MTRAVITVPRDLMRLLRVDWDIDWRETSASEFSDGVTRTQYMGFPRWVGAPQIHLSRALIGRWRAVRAAAQGKRAVYRLPLVDPAVFRLEDAGVTAAQQVTGVPHSTGAYFTTGQGYAAIPVATAALDAARGGESMRLDMTAAGGAVPREGQIMSHADWPFVVTSVTAAGGALYDVTVQMPLRAAVTAGDEVRLQGVGLFEARESGMGRIEYGRLQRSRPELSFVEALQR
jgi:hypothetical protein